MNRLRSGPLAAWASSWLAGIAAADEVLRATTGDDAPHAVAGLRSSNGEYAALTEVLIAWRRAGAPVRLVLPIPGDVRGVPGPAEFRTAALDVGEAVFGGGIGLVPTVIDRAPSSAPVSVIWHAFEVQPAPLDYLAVADAQQELTAAIRDSASALAAADVAGWAGGARAGAGGAGELASSLSQARRSGERVNLPPRFPSPAVALVAQAERLQAVLELAAADATGGAIDRVGIAARSAALRPLLTAVRRARLAGYNAGTN
ncbi:MAG: hypothetical protein M3N95_03935 [Actinomycetota bacterium]|nr:hypothetical protein [Actinomycetota bacterium]